MQLLLVSLLTTQQQTRLAMLQAVLCPSQALQAMQHSSRRQARQPQHLLRPAQQRGLLVVLGLLGAVRLLHMQAARQRADRVCCA